MLKGSVLCSFTLEVYLKIKEDATFQRKTNKCSAIEMGKIRSEFTQNAHTYKGSRGWK